MIFGTRDRDEFLKMRRAELSPLQICELNGKSRVEAQKGVSDALREAAARGVRDGSLPAAQAEVMLDRQLRQVPRWLGQNRYNGPSGGANKPDLPEADAAKHPSISANGLTVVWDAYRADVAQAERFGEIHVRAAVLGQRAVLGHAARAETRRPRSAYNSVVSADGTRGRVRDGRVDVPARQARRPDDRARARPGHRGGHARQPRVPRAGRADAHGLQPGALGRRQHRRVRGHRRRPQRRAVRERPVGRGSQGQARAARDRRVARRRLPAGGRRRRAVRRLHLGRSRQRRADARLPHGAEDRQDDARLARDAAPAEGDAYDPSVSYDGRSVAFTSRARNLGGDGHADVYVRDLRAGTTRLVTGAIKADAGSPSLSADGRYVAFVVRVGRPNGKRESLRSRVWRHDLATGQNVLVSRAAGARGEPGDGLQTDPAISADGQRVAFASTGGNLGEGKPDGIAGVYVRDVARGTTTLLSTHAERPGSGGDVVRVVAPAGSGVAVLASGCSCSGDGDQPEPCARRSAADCSSRGKGAAFPPRACVLRLRAPRGTARSACRSHPSYGHRKSRGSVLVASVASTSSRSCSITPALRTKGVRNKCVLPGDICSSPPRSACSFSRDPQEAPGRAWRSSKCQWPVP